MRWSKSLPLLVCLLFCLPDMACSGLFGWWPEGKRAKQDQKVTGRTSEDRSGVTASPGEQRSAVRKVKVLRKEGGRVSFSRKTGRIAFDRAGQDGYFDVYTMRPDGSELQCLTCRDGGVPQEHNGNPAWHPSGKYIVFQSKNPDLRCLSGHKLARFITSPGVGVCNDLWFIRPDGSAFFPVTRVADRSGTLHPQFSPDGTKLLWGQMVGSRFNRLGYWAIKLADFREVDGVPRLSNVRTFKPGNLQLYEVHGFSPDSKTFLFSGVEEDKYYYDSEIYSMEISSEKVRQLTDNDEWDEHAHFTPSGRSILFLSSEGTPQKKARSMDELIAHPVKLEFWIMNLDGSGKKRLSGFNHEGSPEYRAVDGGWGFGDFDWGPDARTVFAKMRRGKGREAIVLIEFADRSY